MNICTNLNGNSFKKTDIPRAMQLAWQKTDLANKWQPWKTYKTSLLQTNHQHCSKSSNLYPERKAHQWNGLLLRLVDAKSWIWICPNGTWLQTTASDRNIPQTLEQIMGKGSDLSRQMQNITNIVCNNGVWVQCEPPDWVTGLWALALVLQVSGRWLEGQHTTCCLIV